MRVIGRERILEFGRFHPDARTALGAWLLEAEDATWAKPTDIKGRYNSASFIADNRVVFNIKGNHFRLLARIDYTRGLVLVERVGTHAEYSKWQL